MRIRLAYGKNGLWIELPQAWDVAVVTPRFAPALPDPDAALVEALRHPIASAPLRELARRSPTVGIIFSDITRPTPNRQIIPAVLRELAHLPPENITLFNALGTHRPNTDAELREMLGAAVVDNYRIVQNDAFDPSQLAHAGVTARGHEIWLNRALLACDLRILTGFIEPHFFAGFSGGGKAIMPGMAGQRTVLDNHSAEMIADPRATWGVTDGNPIFEEVAEVARTVGNSFLLNVTLNRDKAVTGVFAGDPEQAHAAGCNFARASAMAPVAALFDIVVTTNSGYPLDLNLYQSVKGMSAAAAITRPGGSIIVAAECCDGVPDHGLYGQLLREAESPRELLERITAPGFRKQDQWQAQIQAQIQLKADVYVHSSGLTDAQIRDALLIPCSNITETISALREKYGPDARICVLPEGPQTIPYLAQARTTDDVVKEPDA